MSIAADSRANNSLFATRQPLPFPVVAYSHSNNPLWFTVDFCRG